MPKKLIPPLVSLLAVFVVGVVIFLPDFFDKTKGNLKAQVVTQNDPVVKGWGWSSNIGWVNFNPSTNSPVKINLESYLYGYAWSPNIGWIRFDGWESGPPAGTDPAVPSGSSSDNPWHTAGYNGAHIVNTNGKVILIGWARACSVFADGQCGTVNSTLKDSTQNGGWDGWISFPSIPINVSSDGSNLSSLSGFAWGSLNIGWLNLSYLNIPGTPPNNTNNSCDPTKQVCMPFGCTGSSCATTPTNPTLTVNCNSPAWDVEPTISGTISGNCSFSNSSQSYPSGSPITLTHNDNGHTFCGWKSAIPNSNSNVCNGSTSDTCSFNLSDTGDSVTADYLSCNSTGGFSLSKLNNDNVGSNGKPIFLAAANGQQYPIYSSAVQIKSNGAVGNVTLSLNSLAANPVLNDPNFGVTSALLYVSYVDSGVIKTIGPSATVDVPSSVLNDTNGVYVQLVFQKPDSYMNGKEFSGISLDAQYTASDGSVPKASLQDLNIKYIDPSIKPQ